MRYHFKIHKEGKGYWAECIELPGCVTQADSREELQRNMAESLNLYLDEPEDSQTILPLPRRLKGRNVVAIEVAPQIAFAFSLRRVRLTNKMTQKTAAKTLGMKSLYNYQRLESSKTANPALLTLKILKKVFPDLRLDDILA